MATLNGVTTDVDATEPFQCLTVTVRVRNLWRLRLGLLFVRLAAWALKCGVKVETNDMPTEEPA